MLAVTMLLGLMFLTWAAAVWATFEDNDGERSAPATESNGRKAA
jgi:hypothetical protein